MSSHGGAVAEGSPYLGSIFPVVMLPSTRPGSATHRATTETIGRVAVAFDHEEVLPRPPDSGLTRVSESRTRFPGRAQLVRRSRLIGPRCPAAGVLVYNVNPRGLRAGRSGSGLPVRRRRQ